MAPYLLVLAIAVRSTRRRSPRTCSWYRAGRSCMPQRCESSLSSSFSSPSPSPSLALRLLLPLAAFLPPFCRRRRRRRSRLGWLVLARVVRGSSGGGGGGGGRVFADPTSARVSTVVMVECAVHRGPIGTPPSRALTVCRSCRHTTCMVMDSAVGEGARCMARRRPTRPDGDVGRPELASWAHLAARAAGRPGGGPGRQWARKGRVAVPSALVLGAERNQGWCTARRGHADAPPFGSSG